MAAFTVIVGTFCTGAEHLSVTVTIGGNSRILDLSKTEFQEGPGNLYELATRIRERIYSAIKESGATTRPQLITALENKTFRV